MGTTSVAMPGPSGISSVIDTRMIVARWWLTPAPTPEARTS
jgi:hypothetical protein